MLCDRSGWSSHMLPLAKGQRGGGRQTSLVKTVLAEVPAGTTRPSVFQPNDQSAGRKSGPERLLQQLAGDHHALDLVGALVDLGDLGVAHHPLDREVLGVAVAAEAAARRRW